MLIAVRRDSGELPRLGTIEVHEGRHRWVSPFTSWIQVHYHDCPCRCKPVSLPGQVHLPSVALTDVLGSTAAKPPSPPKTFENTENWSRIRPMILRPIFRRSTNGSSPSSHIQRRRPTLTPLICD